MYKHSYYKIGLKINRPFKACICLSRDVSFPVYSSRTDEVFGESEVFQRNQEQKTKCSSAPSATLAPRGCSRAPAALWWFLVAQKIYHSKSGSRDMSFNRLHFVAKPLNLEVCLDYLVLQRRWANQFITP